MLEASGVIVAFEGDQALVQVDQSGCGRCHEPGGCGGNPLNQLFGNAPRCFRVQNPGGLAVGACVTLVIAEGAIRRSAMRAYAQPLIVLFLGAFIGLWLNGEGGAIFGALIGLLCAGLMLRHAHMNSASAPRDRPYIKHHAQVLSVQSDFYHSGRDGRSRECK